MPISQVGSATTDAVNNGDTITLSKPTGVASGHVLIACMTQNENTITPPSGFTLIREVTGGETTNTWSAHIYYKVAGGSEPSSYTFTHDGGTTAPFAGVLSAWSGVNNSNPINASSELANGGSSEPASGPTLTTTANSRRLCVRGCRKINGSAITFSSSTSGWTELAEVAGTSSGSVRYSICQYARTADDSSGSGLTTAAITASESETDNGWFHIALEAGDPTDSDSGVGTDGGESIAGTVADSDSAVGTDSNGEVAIPSNDTETATGTDNESIVTTNDTIVSDNFNRADETSLTTSSSGHTWTNGATQTIGVVNNRAEYTGNGSEDAIFYLNDGGINFSNARIQMTISSVEEDKTNTEGPAIRFRRSDENNWWEFGTRSSDTTYVLTKNVDGILTTVSEPGVQRAAGDILRVECFEEAITCYVNQTMVVSITDAELKDDRTVGIRFSSGSVDSSVDNFSAILLSQDFSELLTFYPDYQVLVDWDNDDGLNIGHFEIEENIDEWTTFGSLNPNLELSPELTKSGFNSMRVEWQEWNLLQFDVAGHGFGQGKFAGDEFSNPPIPFKFNEAGQGFDDGAFAVIKEEGNPDVVQPGFKKTIENLIVGRKYTLRSYVWVTQDHTHVTMSIEGLQESATSTVYNQWEELSFEWTALETSHNIMFTPVEENPGNLEEFYLDEIMNIGDNEDVTDFVLGLRTPLNFRYGRDQARSLASIAPGEIEMEFDNETQIFSPDNPGSLLAGFLLPGRPMVIRATYNNQTVHLFHGFIDNYQLNPETEDRSVEVSCMDALQYVANTDVTTDLYPSIQTGEAINVILDQIGWPETRRDIDQGASTIRWWHLEVENGISAISDLVHSEGLPSIAYVDQFGNFVFKSRHHRLLQGRSTAIQSYIRESTEFDEPNFSPPMTYDIGWKDIINNIDVDIDLRMPEEFQEVYSTDEHIVINSGDTYTLNFRSSNPFYGAVTPSVAEGTLEVAIGSNEPSSVSLSRTSGQSGSIDITAGSGEVSLRKVSIMAFPVTSRETLKSVSEDSTSIQKYGPQSLTEEFPWTNINDMNSISEVILGQRSERLPVVHITLNNGHPIRISNILNRALSDRVHIVEMQQSFVNDDFFVEVIEHDIREAGQVHHVTLGCEKSREQSVIQENEEPLTAFTFDVTGAGFDDGFFIEGGEGFTFSDKLFILDQSNLDEDGLGF